MTLFLIFFFTTYGVVNLYILRRLIQSLEAAPKWFKLLMIFLHILVILSYFIAKGLLNNTYSISYDIFLYIGSFGFAAFVYALQILLLMDLGRFIFRKTKYAGFLKNNYPKKKFIAFGVVIGLLTMIITLGEMNANDIIVKDVHIEIPTKNAPYPEFKVMFFSDLHLSPLNDERQLRYLIRLNKKIIPDMILMGGDIVDDVERNLYRNNVGLLMKKLFAPKGVYTVMGNHEYIVGIEKSVNFLRGSGIQVLRDTVLVIDDFLQFMGRDDFTSHRSAGNKRKELSELIKKTTPSKPVILIDHQPYNLNDVTRYKVDLQLSGHTHNGQMFPGNLITELIYEVSYGLKKIGNTRFYVSSGVGTWGPPVRIGSRSEVVLVNLKFVSNINSLN